MSKPKEPTSAIDWIIKDAVLSLIGPYGKVTGRVLSAHDQFVTLRIDPKTELSSPKLPSEREQLKEARRPHE